MQTVDLYDAPPFRLTGIHDVRRTPNGIRVSRVPSWVQDQITDPGFLWAAGVPSGARLELVTDSTSISLDVQLLRLHFAGNELQPAAFDLFIDGELRDVVYTDSGHVARYDGPRPEDMRLIRGDVGTI